MLHKIETPLGEMLLEANEKGLTGAWFLRQKHFPTKAMEYLQNSENSTLASSSTEQSKTFLTLAKKELDLYFAGNLKNFSLPLAPEGTDFQKQVWSILCKIPYGQTFTYSAVAEQMHNPKAVRAVGGSIGRNPLSIFIPCHRVLGKNSSLTGYAGGLARKKCLLDMESGKHFSWDSCTDA